MNGFGEVGEAAEFDADGRTARPRLGPPRGPDIFDCLARVGKIGGQAGGIGMRRDLGEFRFAGRAGHVAA